MAISQNTIDFIGSNLNFDGVTPAVLKDLVRLGVDTGNALTQAISQRKYREALDLIKAGVDLDGQNDKGDTPLLVMADQAVFDDQCKAVALALITAGANLNVQGMHEDTPLIAALRNIQYCPEVVDGLLEKGVFLDVQNKDGDTALMMAIEFSHTDAALALINAGADVNVPNKKGDTPLSLAQNRDFEAIVAALKAAGAK